MEHDSFIDYRPVATGCTPAWSEYAAAGFVVDEFDYNQGPQGATVTFPDGTCAYLSYEGPCYDAIHSNPKNLSAEEIMRIARSAIASFRALRKQQQDALDAGGPFSPFARLFGGTIG